MANIGVGETFNAFLVKASDITAVDSFLKTSATETTATCEQMQPFRYRYVDMREGLAQPIAAWLKGKEDRIIFTSETSIDPKPNDRIYDGFSRYFIVVSVRPQRQLGAFVISKKFPFIIELR